MSVQTKTIIIDGDEYEITQLGAKQGRRLWLMIVKTVAIPVRHLDAIDSLSKEAMVSIIAAAVEGLDEKTLEIMYETFGANSTVFNAEKGARPTLTGVVFDQHFAGRYLTLSKWLWECVSFNFLDFLGDLSLGNLAGKMQSLTEKTKREPAPPSSPRTTSIGSSGGS